MPKTNYQGVHGAVLNSRYHSDFEPSPPINRPNRRESKSSIKTIQVYK